MTKHILSASIVAVFLHLAMGFALLFPPASSASGSHSGYETDPQTKFNEGKAVFYEKIICAACPYPDLDLNPRAIKEIFPDLEFSGKTGKSLGIFERRALHHFLKVQFDL